jgi:hypothetical protein
MSYLTPPRLTFTGNFQADVSTVNNDPRHFDNATFTSSFQEFRTPEAQNGWWNPIGTGIFRLSGCRVQAAFGPDGEAPDDPVLGLLVGNAPDRPSAKIVDIDPEWQLASQIYGLSVSLIDPKTRRVVLVGDYEHAPFRDLWFTRGGGSGDSGASAIWQSVLTNLRWDLDGIDSPFLRALADAARGGALSIRLSTFAFKTSATSPMFTYGTLVGAIGPAVPGEPKTFIAGRRLMPLNGSATDDGISCFSSAIDAAAGTLTADLSNALPLDSKGDLRGLGNLHFAVLVNPDTPEGTTVDAGGYVAIGPLDQSHHGLFKHSGIQTLRIPAAARALAGDRPLALIRLGAQGTHGGGVVVLRELPGGREVRADVFSFRLDPNDSAKNRRTSTIYATCYGKPLAGARIAFLPSQPQPDTDDTPASKDPAATPKAPVPFYNTPVNAVEIAPAEPVTGDNGQVDVEFIGPKRFGAPRQYLDGQLYAINYNFAGESATLMQQFDQISILVFSSFDATAQPAWAEVQPIFQQYANLYPVMSKGLFDFSRQEVADQNAHLLYFSLSKPEDDPGYMPVTRDLSAGKRAAMLRYLEGVLARGGAATAHEASSRFRSRCPFTGVAPSRPIEDLGPGQIIFNKLRSR